MSRDNFENYTVKEYLEDKNNFLYYFDKNKNVLTDKDMDLMKQYINAIGDEEDMKIIFEWVNGKTGVENV